MFSRKQNQKGFTLIETLVAITILIIGVLGPLTIAVRGITDGFFARNQITANYLAQEAVEVVLNKRFSNEFFQESNPWEGLSQCFESSCIVNAEKPDHPITQVGNCDDGKCWLVFDKSRGYFRHPDYARDDATGPIFQRAVTMESIFGPPNDTEVRVTVTVNWNNLAMPRKLSLVENIYRYETTP